MKQLLALVAIAVLAGTASVQAATELINVTSKAWKYSADNSDQYALGFPNVDDSAWPEGLPLFGNDTAVNYRYPFVTTVPGSAGGVQTSYYRTHFTWVGSPAGVVFTMTNMIDDGIVMFLNGTEIMRWNVNSAPGVPLTHATQATAANPGGEPVIMVHQVALSALTNGAANPLVAGDNVLAVAVHQAGTGSSDSVFGLSVHYSQVVPPCKPTVAPASINTTACRSATFTATLAADCGTPAPTLQWFRNVGFGDEAIAGANGLTLTLNNLTAADAGQYKVTATNPGGSQTSDAVSLTVAADTQGPRIVSAVAVNPGEILVTFDEPYQTGAAAEDAFTWEIFRNGVSVGNVNLATAVQGQPTQLLLTHSITFDVGATYSIRTATDADIADACAGAISPGGTLTATILLPGPISVGATGTATYTFDTQPYKEEFSTASWPGGAGTDTPATMDANVELLDISTLTLTALAPATGNPPAAGTLPVWASDMKALATRPTTVLGELVFVTLRNDSGAARSGLELHYDLAASNPVTEEIQGHAVYFSTTGAANSWTKIDGISGDGTAGAKVGTIDLSGAPWAQGSLLYVLFADDNGSGSPDTALSIDNFKVVPVSVSVTAPTITVQPVGVSVAEGRSFTLSVTATGSTPSYEWSKGGVVIPGATASTYTVAAATAADAGSYTVRVFNSAGSVTSSSAQVVVRTRVIGYGATWKYETNCQDSTLGGTPWYASAFSDAGWQSGPGPFGIETTAATIARIPPIVTPLPPPAATYLTTYFRSSVTIPAVGAGETLVLSHVIDDGADFYVDGNLFYTYNMGGGRGVSCTTLTPGAVPGDGDAREISAAISIPAGTHLIAVEVHQNSATSSDVVFGAEITRGPAFPRLSITRPTPTTVQITWTPTVGVHLAEAATVNGVYTPVAGNPQGTYTATLPAGAAEHYYILRY